MQETYASEVNIPTFTEHPESMKVLYGDTVKFKVTAFGTNLKYQWQYKPSTRNGTWTNTGSNSNELSVLVTYHDEYLYRCLISDDVYSGDSAIQSNAACLHVITDQVFKVQHISEVPTAPVITTQPQPVQTVMGSTATFTVEATGDNLVYQWQYKPSVLNGTWTNATEASAKTNTYTTSALTFANTGYEYRCIVRDNDGYYYGDQNAVTSDSAMVRVIPEGYTKVIYINESYNITAHPASRLVLPGESVTFSVVAEGNTDLTYRWLYKTTEENSTWTEVPSSMGTGAQTDTLVINKVLDEYDNYMFRCSVGGSIYVYEKSLLSNVAYLMTIEPQQIVTAQYKPSFSVNGTYYPFLQSAYDAIEGTEGTIVVCEDAEDDSTIVIEDGKNITIDTNGKTLTLTTAGITNNGTLTIDGTGTIKTTNNAIDSVVYNNGTLNVVNGTIEGPKNVVYNASTGNLTVGASGGSVSTSSPALIGGTYGVNSETGFNFYDGVMKGTTAAYNGEILEIEDEYTLLETSETVNSVTKQVAMLQMEITPSVMITEWTIPAGGATIKLPVAGTGLNVMIDWGDGTSETWTDTTKFPEHTYTNVDEQKFDIKVKGTCPQWGYNEGNAPVESDANTGKYYTYSQYLTGLKQWGDLNATSYGFSNCISLKYVSGDATENTFTKMNTMFNMFRNCTALESLDLSNFKTDNVTNMSKTFYNCRLLKELNFESFNTENVTNMTQIFYECRALTILDLSMFDVKKVQDMAGMFMYCTNLESLNLDNFETDSVTSMYDMFNRCGKLTTLDLSSFNTSNVTNMGGMFYSCNALKILDVSSFNVERVTSMWVMFEGCSSLTTLDLSSFITISLDSAGSMFNKCSSLVNLDISGFDTSKVTNMSSMFAGCSHVTSIDLSNFDTSKVINMGGMFSNCSSLKSVDVSHFDTSKVTNMNSMFSNCSSLKSVDVSHFDTSKVTNMNSMFIGCSSLTSIDLSSFDTSKVTNMSYMFGSCEELESLNMENADTSSVTTMNGMYNNCKNLKSILISDKFVISGDTKDMFKSCTNLSAIITTSSTPVVNQFKGQIPSTATLYVPNGSESAYAEALSGDSSVTVAPILQQVGNKDIVLNIGSDYTDAGYTVAGFTPDESDYYTVYGYSATASGDVDTYKEGTYPIKYDLTRTVTNASGDATTTDIGKVTRNVEIVDKTSFMITEWTIPAGGAEIKLPVKGNGLDITIDWGDGTITKVSGDLTEDDFPTHTYTNTEEKKFDIAIRGNCPEFGYYSGNAVTEEKNAQYLTFVNHLTGLKQWGRLNATRYGFAGCTNLTYVSGDAVSDTFNNVTIMNNMFNNCTSLESIDLSKFNTSNVTSMQSMFNGCSSLMELNVSSFDTSKVEYMDVMFGSCNKLTTLNLSNFNTTEVLTMSDMFSCCEQLTNLNVTSFNTINVESMSYMFAQCKNLKNLYIKNFNTENVTNMSYMFNGCTNIEKLDLSNFNTFKVGNMAGMFQNCDSLTELDLSNFDTSNVTNMHNMFWGASSLKNINLSSFNTSKVTNMSGMFAGTAIEYLDLSHFDTSKVTTMYDMFGTNSKLETVDISGFTTSGDTNMGIMFENNKNLKSIQISNKFVIPETATNMFNGCTNLSAIITVSDTPNENQFNSFATVVPSTVKLYVPNGSEEAYIETISGDISGDKIAPLLQMKGDSYVVLNLDDDYVEDYYTVAGFTKDEASAYEVYGYSVNTSGDVDTSNLGVYNVEYTLTRTYTSGDEEVTTPPKTEIREVEVTDKSLWMVTEWTIPAGVWVKLPISGDVDIVVDWGDDSELQHIKGTFNSDNYPEHYYEKADKYDIAIRGKLDEWGNTVIWQGNVSSDKPYYSYVMYLTGLKQWGELGAQRYGFTGCTYLTYVSGDATAKSFENLNNMEEMFLNCKKVTSIDLSKFDTSKVTSMRGTFNVMEKITYLDLSSFDTSNVETFFAMFESCTELKNIKFGEKFTTDVATDMTAMFNLCKKLESLDLSMFNTSNVKTMEAMFRNCRAITSINLSSFDTSSCEKMTRMFDSCYKIKNLDLSNFNTTNVKNMSYMFYYCYELSKLDLSSFDVSNVENMMAMFLNCTSIKEIDLSSWGESKVTNNMQMFYGCTNLESVDLRNFKTPNLKMVFSMFNNCTSLKKVYMNKLYTTNVSSYYTMFNACRNLTYLDLTNYDTTNSINMVQLFSGDTSLESILITNKFVTSATSTDMFADTQNLNAIIIVSEETNGSQFATVKDQMEGKIFYVPNVSVEAYREAFSGDYSGDKVQPILQLLGKEKVNILMGNPYEEMNYTVAGFGIDEIERYLVYGYNVEISGDVDIWQAGEYKLDYILTRTYQNASGETVEEKNVATRIVTVYDKPILTLYENGELYDGEWTSNNIVGVMELLAPESTWISVKAGNSEWTVNPQYAEIVKSGDEMTITFTESMGEYVYVREIDTKGHATTYETSGDMIKIDREAPIIKNFHGETKDKLLNIVAAVSDDVSGIKEYVVTETTVFPREWQAYDSGDISYPVPNSGIYYLWLKDNANNISSGEIYATRDVIPPRGIIEIEPVNILSGDGFKNIIVVNKDKISGEKYTNKDTVNIDIHITDNETDEEELMFALYNEDEYTAVKRGEKRIEWRQYVPRVEWPLPQDEGDYVVYAIFKDNAGNESMTLGEFADQALTTFVVHHYLENPNDTGYSAYEISTEIGRAGVAVDVNSIVKEIPGAIYEKASLRLDGVATTSIVVEGDGTTEVYLHYKRTRHELVLNSNEAIASVNTAGMYKWGQTVILEATLGNDIAYNYGFTNWVVNSGDVTIVEPEKLRTQFRMPSGDVEITAIGTKDIKTFTINFNANGGEVTPASKTLEYYENYGELPTPTRNGYDFIGWYTSPTGGEEIDTTIAPNSNRTIYAHWHSLLLADYVDVGQYVNLGINYSNVPTADTTTQTPTLTGWRVLSVDNGNDGEKYVRLVSAGIPLTYVHKYGSTGDGELSENNLTTGFFDIPLNKTTATDYQFHRSGFGSSVTNNTTLKQVFLNNDYIAVDENGTPKVQSMTLSDVQSIYNIHKTGTVGNSTEVNDAIFDEMLALKSSDSSYYARYHLATEAFENYLWCSYNSGAVVYSGGEMGVRPVVTLRADVIQKGQNANGVWQIGFDE